MSTQLLDLQAVPVGFVDPRDELRRHLRSARRIAVGLLLCLLLLATVIQLNSAVAASGEVTVASKVKKLTHPTGGVLSALYVRDGDRVRAGQILMRFDTTVSGVSAQTAGKTFEQLLAMQARLRAETDGAASVSFPPELLAMTTPSARIAIAAERNLFIARRDARTSQHIELAARVTEAEHAVSSEKAQIEALHQQSALIAVERENMEQLYAKQLTTLARLNELKRTAIALESDAAALAGQIAQARAQMADLRQQMLQIDQDTRSQAGVELADVTAKVSEQQLRKSTASDTLERSVIRAPQSGIVDKLAFTTVGSFVPATETILEIVPDRDRLIVEAKVSPNDIDEIHPGEQAELRFSAFNTRTTPEIEGKVRTASADRKTDERSGASYYVVEIEIAPGQLKRLQGLVLVPGMPVEVFVQTGRRSMLSYLLKPLSDQMNRSFHQS